MNEKITEKLLQYLQSTEDFILEHAPDTIMQIFKYEKISTIYQLALMIVLLFIFSILGIYIYNNPSLDKYGSREAPSFLIPLICTFVSPIFFVQTCFLIDRLVKMYMAPKYFLIEMVLNLKK